MKDFREIIGIVFIILFSVLILAMNRDTDSTLSTKAMSLLVFVIAIIVIALLFL